MRVLYRVLVSKTVSSMVFTWNTFGSDIYDTNTRVLYRVFVSETGNCVVSTWNIFWLDYDIFLRSMQHCEMSLTFAVSVCVVALRTRDVMDVGRVSVLIWIRTWLCPYPPDSFVAFSGSRTLCVTAVLAECDLWRLNKCKWWCSWHSSVACIRPHKCCVVLWDDLVSMVRHYVIVDVLVKSLCTRRQGRYVDLHFPP